MKSASSTPSSQSWYAGSPNTSARCFYSLSLASRALLSSYALNDLVQICFHHHAADDHLTQCCMHRLEAKDEVQLTDVFEEAVQRFDENLDQIDQGERRLGGRGDHDEGQSRICSVGDLRRGIRWPASCRRASALGEQGRKREEIARGGRPPRDEVVDLRDQPLLRLGILEKNKC